MSVLMYFPVLQHGPPHLTNLMVQPGQGPQPNQPQPPQGLLEQQPPQDAVFTGQVGQRWENTMLYYWSL